MLDKLKVEDITHVALARKMYDDGDISGQEYLDYLSAVESYRLDNPMYSNQN